MKHLNSLLVGLGLLLVLGITSCKKSNNTSGGGGGGGGSSSATLCNGSISYDMDGLGVSANSANASEIAVVSIDFGNGIVQIQANYTDSNNISYSLVLNFTGVTAPGAAIIAPTSVAYTVIDASNATVLETYLSLSPGDFTCNFSALDITGAAFTFAGGLVTGGPIGGATIMHNLSNGVGDNQSCS